MKALLVSLALLAACAHDLFDPRYIDHAHHAEGSTHTYVGYPIVVRYCWDCPSSEFRGYSKTDPMACTRVLDDLRVKCLRSPCRIDKVEHPPGQLGHGAVTVQLTPLEAGDLLVSSDIYKGKDHIAWAEELVRILPAPEMTIACDVRDARTGDYVPCPALLPAGSEVEISFTARFAPASEHPIRIEWEDLEAAKKDGAICKSVTRASVSVVTCTIAPTRSNRLVWSFGNITQSRQLDVASPTGSR